MLALMNPEMALTALVRHPVEETLTLMPTLIYIGTGNQFMVVTPPAANGRQSIGVTAPSAGIAVVLKTITYPPVDV